MGDNNRVPLRVEDNDRVPLWIVSLFGGLAAMGILTLFLFGSYSGLGSSL
jgi:hypothetical protein